MIDFLEKRRLKHFLRLEYPTHVVFVHDGVRGSHPDLPGCEAFGASVDIVYTKLLECRRRWIRDRLRKGRSVPLPNCHLQAMPGADIVAPRRARAS